ncbi:unnamed protein product, partial [Ascophyllum nodosum]
MEVQYSVQHGSFTFFTSTFQIVGSCFCRGQKTEKLCAGFFSVLRGFMKMKRRVHFYLNLFLVETPRYTYKWYLAYSASCDRLGVMSLTHCANLCPCAWDGSRGMFTSLCL